MSKYKYGEWYQDEHVGGFIDEKGVLHVCEEYGTDADFDTHSIDVQNGYGYYDEFGRYQSYHLE